MLSIQDQLFPSLTCFGCGPANTQGLQIKSYATPEGVTGIFVPRPEHDNGLGVLNGGIVATLLDCHGGAAVMWHDFELSGERDRIWVTAGLDIRYRRPSPLDRECGLRAELLEVEESEMRVRTEVLDDGRVCAIGEARWVKPRTRSAR
ncbi:MAG: hypothetical protein RJB01_109 [Actinomycetota bacterium]